MFLLVIRGLFNHKLPTVRRKAMELLNTRLQHQGSFFSSCNHETLYSLLTPLLSVMGSIGSDTVKPDLETNQQVAMLSVKLLARHLAPENPSQFKQVNCCSVSWNKYVHEQKQCDSTVCPVKRALLGLKVPQLCPLVLLTIVVLRWRWMWPLVGSHRQATTEVLKENLPHFQFSYDRSHSGKMLDFVMLKLIVHIVTAVIHMVWASSKPGRDFCSIERRWLCKPNHGVLL